MTVAYIAEKREDSPQGTREADRASASRESRVMIASSAYRR